MTRLPKMNVNKKRGFSLRELTVVLGIVGTVLSGIWAVVGSSRSDMMAMQLSDQTALLVNNVRAYYAGRSLPTAAINATTFTTTMRDAGVFPGDMCNSQCMAGTYNPGNAFGGTTVLSVPGIVVTPGAPQTEFQVTYSNVPKKACVNLGMALSQNASTTGLTWMKITGGSDTYNFPLTLAQLTSNCASSNTVRLRYRIRL